MSEKFEEMFGEVAGKGAQATVYVKGDYAVKLYREGYPKRNVFSEALIMAGLEEVNFPGPRIYEVLYVDGRYGLRMDRVKGTLMSEFMTEEKCKETLDALVELQCRLQKCDGSGLISGLKERFHGDLLRNAALPSELKEKHIKALEKLPDGTAVCHCDFHSGNVFFDGNDYTIIDLLQICRGDPAGDAACSYVAYSLLGIPELGEYYLEKYCKVSGISKEHILRWCSVYAGTIWGQVPDAYMPIVETFAKGE